MKTIFFLLFACLLINSSTNAQSTTQKKATTASSVQLGIKAGVNISNIQRENDAYDSKTGFHVGGLAHIHLSYHFAVQPEITYSTQGAEAGVVKLNQNYINVPVLLQFMTNNGFRLQTGPQACFLVSAKTKNGNFEEDVMDELNNVTFAWSFGTSYITKSGLGLDVRYNLGLSNINDDSSPSPVSKNRVWQIGAFYQFSH